MAEVSSKSKAFFELALPYIQTAGQSLIVIDPNTDGADDLVGGLLIYTGEIIEAVLDEEDIPPVPEYLLDRNRQPSFVGKRFSTSHAAFYLKFAVPFLMLASSELRGKTDKGATALKYVVEVVQSILTAKILPAPPSGFVKGSVS